MDFLNDIVEITGNEFATIGKTMNDDRTTIDTGAYILNALLSGSIYGGAPSNGVTGFAGESTTGKTYMILTAVRSFQEKYPDSLVVFFESEGAISRNMLTERGIDADRVAVIPVVTIQDFRTQSTKILDKYQEQKPKDRQKMLFVLDSLGMLSTNKEVNDIAEGKDTRDMTRAQLIRGAFRILTLKLSMHNVPLFVTNHTYAAIGGMFPTQEVSGGGGFKFAASTIVMLSKRKEKVGNDIVGNIIHCKTYKSRLSKENQMVDVKLYYDSGLDRYYGLLEFADKYGIIEKMGSRYVIDGKKLYGKTIYEEPEKYFTEELLNKIDEKCKTVFSYGSEKPVIEDNDEGVDNDEN